MIFTQRVLFAKKYLKQYKKSETISNQTKTTIKLKKDHIDFLNKLVKNLLKTNPKDKKIISKVIFYTIKQCSQNPKEIFPILYFILIGEKQGPRISDIIATYGIKKTTDILKRTSLI